MKTMIDADGIIYSWWVPNPADYLGYIPEFLSISDPDSVVKQFSKNYLSGWHSFKGFKFGPEDMSIKYPGDPIMKPAVRIDFRDEVIFVYPSAWVLVLQSDGSYEIARMD